jgi:heme a synthase
MLPTAIALLALTGLLVAVPPLLYVRFSRSTDRHQKLAWVTVFLVVDLIMFGGFTRLTDSGLGCPDWPGCYGHANPVSASEPIRAAAQAMPTGPVTMMKAWIEMVHRYFAMAVGVLIIALMIQAWRRWRNDPSRSPWFPTLIFLLVCVQGAFGAWTVTLRLQPLIVTTHLLLGLTLLSALVWLAMRETERRFAPVAGGGLRTHAMLALLLLFVQIALGGWVSSNYAVMACPDFPACHGQWLPDADYQHGFTLWRKLGMTGAGDWLPFNALVAIHWVHRTVAYLVIAVLGALAWRAWRVPGLEVQARWLATLLAVQFLTGLSNVVLSWPLPLAVAHNGGAALLVLVLVMVNFRIKQAQNRA